MYFSQPLSLLIVRVPLILSLCLVLSCGNENPRSSSLPQYFSNESAESKINSKSSSKQQSPKFKSDGDSISLEGDWKLSPEAAALAVGPNQGDENWWSNSLGDLTVRDCLFDDVYRFNVDGSFENVMDGLTWLEPWQNPESEERCGLPVAPHNGSNSAEWVYNDQTSTLTVSGLGAHIGLPKATNGYEISSPSSAVSSIVYTVSSLTETTMTLDIFWGYGWWRFKLVKDITDSDGDGILDSIDQFPANQNYHLDSDFDGMPDLWEDMYGLNRYNSDDATSDQDNDNVQAIDEFTNGTAASGSLDIDGDGQYDALTDGLLLLRYFFGLTGDSLLSGVISTNGRYRTYEKIDARIGAMAEHLDFDSNNENDALTDGILALRYLFGIHSSELINGAVSLNGTRTSLEDVLSHFDTLKHQDADNDGVYDQFDMYPNNASKVFNFEENNAGNETESENEEITVPYDTPRLGKIDGAQIWQLPNSPTGDRPDQCWLAVGSDVNGDIYISGHDHHHNSMLYRMFQKDQTLRYVGDARSASIAASNWLSGETAEKFHTRPIYHNDQVYVATLDTSDMNYSYLNTRGFHWYGYNLSEQAFVDLSASEPNGVGAEHLQIVSIQKDPKNNLLYGMSIPENKLVKYDIAQGETTVLGRPSAWNNFFYSNRFMWVDSRGRVYISGGSSRSQWHKGESASTFNHIWYYDPVSGFGELANFSLQGPNAMEVGQWDRTRQRLYTSDDQGNIYRFEDAAATWEFLGRPDFSSALKTWVFQLSADEQKIYIGLSDGSRPNAIYEYDIASGTSFELLKISELDNLAAIENFITGYDSWDSEGSFYISNFSMYDGDNTFMLGINPVRIKVAKGLLPELIEISAELVNNMLAIKRTGSATDVLEVIYELRAYNANEQLVANSHGNATLPAGEDTLLIDPDSLSLPQAATIDKIIFSIVADGNDYVVSAQRHVELADLGTQ